MLSQLSIRAKIISRVSLLLLALAGMGLLAATSLRSLNANTREIAGNWLPSIKVLGELHADVITFRAVIRQHMIMETKEDKAGAETALSQVLGSERRRAHCSCAMNVGHAAHMRSFSSRSRRSSVQQSISRTTRATSSSAELVSRGPRSPGLSRWLIAPLVLSRAGMAPSESPRFYPASPPCKREPSRCPETSSGAAAAHAPRAARGRIGPRV